MNFKSIPLASQGRHLGEGLQLPDRFVCPAFIEARYAVRSTGDINRLAAFIGGNCKKAYVLWAGALAVAEPIKVGESSHLIVRGTGGRAALLGDGKTSLISMAAASTLEAMHMDFVEANAAGVGGAVSAGPYSHVIMASVRFMKNNASRGGALSLDMFALAEITGSTFTNNTAVGDADQTGNGAAMMLSYGALATIADSTFAYNTAQREGGAIYSHGRLIITNSTFHENSNTDPLDGGAIWSDASQVIDAPEAGTDWRTAKLSVSGSTFSGGYAGKNGGAIFVAGEQRCSFRMTDSLVTGVRVKDGGSIHSKCYSTFESVTFENNTAGWGAAVHTDGVDGITEFINCTFRNNHAEFGGAIYTDGGSDIPMFIDGCSFEGNKATISAGGAIDMGTNTNITVANSNFAHNAATFRGGAIMVRVSAILSITNSVITNNSGQYGGGLFYAGVSNARTSLVNVTLRSNSAHVTGGGMYLETGTKGRGVNLTFEDNSAKGGGAVFAQGVLPDLALEGAAFVRNAADGPGGAVLQEAGATGALALAGATTFDGNSALCCYSEGLPLSALSAAGATCSDMDTAASSRRCCIATEYAITGQDECQSCDTTKLNCDHVGITQASLPLRDGYWIAARGLGQDSVLECYSHDACPGTQPTAGSSLTSTDVYCAEGYTGPYCAVCERGYHSGIGYTCSKCDAGFAVTVVLVALVALLIAAALLWVAALSYRPNGKARSATADPRADLHGHATSASGGGGGGGGGGGSCQQRLSDALYALARGTVAVLSRMRIPVVVLQVTTSFAATTGILFPPAYQAFLNALSVVNFNIVIVPFSCIVPTSFYATLLLSTLGPPVLLAVVVGIRAALKHRRAVSYRSLKDVASQEQDIVLVFLFLIFSSVSTTIFKTFACDDLEGTGGASYLRADYSISCTTPRHVAYQIYAAAMIVVYPVGIPAVYAWHLWRVRRAVRAAPALYKSESKDKSESETKARGAPPPDLSADESRQLAATEFLWRPYRPKVYYFELFECLRRLMLTGILVFTFPGSVGQCAVACALAIVFLAAYGHARPHASALDASAYFLGAGILALNMLVALLIRGDYLAADARSEAAIGALLLALNVLLLAVAPVAHAALLLRAVSEGAAAARRGDSARTWSMRAMLATAGSVTAVEAPLRRLSSRGSSQGLCEDAPPSAAQGADYEDRVEVLGRVEAAAARRAAHDSPFS